MRETPDINKKAYEIVDLKNNPLWKNNNDSEDNKDFDPLKAYDVELANLMKKLEEKKEQKEKEEETPALIEYRRVIKTRTIKSLPDDLRNEVLGLTCIDHKICEDTSLKDAFDLINSGRRTQLEEIANGLFVDKDGQVNTNVSQKTWLSSLKHNCFDYAMEIQREIMEEIKQVATEEEKKGELMIDREELMIDREELMIDRGEIPQD